MAIQHILIPDEILVPIPGAPVKTRLAFTVFLRSLRHHRIFTTPAGIDAGQGIDAAIAAYEAAFKPESEEDPPWFLSLDGQDYRCLREACENPGYSYPQSGGLVWIEGYMFPPEICQHLGSYRKAIMNPSITKPEKPAWWRPRLALVADDAQDTTKTG